MMKESRNFVAQPVSVRPESGSRLPSCPRTRKALKLIFRLANGLVLFLAGVAAVVVFLVVDREAVCEGSYEKFGRVFFIPCVQADINEAESAIQAYYSKAAGANPYNGWELLSPDLQGRLGVTDFQSQWSGIAYSEVQAVRKSELNEYNTFDVEFTIYRVDDSDRYGGTNTYSGEIDRYKAKLQLKKLGRIWLVHRQVSMMSRQEPRETVEFPRARVLSMDYSTREFPTEDSPKIYHQEIQDATSPVYCSYKANSDGSGNSKEWVRTSMGWLKSTEVKVDKGKPRECQPENIRILLDTQDKNQKVF